MKIFYMCQYRCKCTVFQLDTFHMLHRFQIIMQSLLCNNMILFMYLRNRRQGFFVLLCHIKLRLSNVHVLVSFWLPPHMTCKARYYTTLIPMTSTEISNWNYCQIQTKDRECFYWLCLFPRGRKHITGYVQNNWGFSLVISYFKPAK